MKLTRLVPMAGLLMLTAACASPGANTVQLAQERHACAETSIDPGTQAFGQCVGNLDATMFEAHNEAVR